MMSFESITQPESGRGWLALQTESGVRSRRLEPMIAGRRSPFIQPEAGGRIPFIQPELGKTWPIAERPA